MQDRNNLSAHSSHDYDLQIKDTIPYYESFHNETLNLIKTILNKPKLWLDTGCGTGTLVLKALNMFDSTIFILADPSINMLELAKVKLSKNINKNVFFLEPKETGQITLDKKPDVVTAIQAHHYLTREGRENATKSCYNMLNDDGVYVTFENVRPATSEGIEIAIENWKKFQIERGRSIETVENHLKRFDTEYFPITIDEHRSLLKKSGFKIFDVFWISYMQAGFYGVK